MNFRTLSVVSGILGMAFGAASTLAQPFMASLYGLPTEAANIGQARAFGGVLFVWGLIAFALRDLAERAAQRALLAANTAGYAIQLVLTLHGIGTGTLNAVSWSSVAIYLALAAATLLVMRRTAPVHAVHAGR